MLSKRKKFTNNILHLFFPVPHVRNGVKYNDDQYLVKLARPADVVAEPLYANNKPDHYAVGGAVGGIIGLAEGKGELPTLFALSKIY